MASHVVEVRGQHVDLEAVYEAMVVESNVEGGHRVHIKGLKYLLGRMYGLRVDHRTPTQPLRAMREQTVAELQRLGWIEPIPGKNNGVYYLRK